MRSYFENKLNFDRFEDEFLLLFKDDLKICSYIEFHLFSSNKKVFNQAIKFIKKYQNENSLNKSMYKFIKSNKMKDNLFYQIWIFY